MSYKIILEQFYINGHWNSWWGGSIVGAHTLWCAAHLSAFRFQSYNIILEQFHANVHRNSSQGEGWHRDGLTCSDVRRIWAHFFSRHITPFWTQFIEIDRNNRIWMIGRGPITLMCGGAFEHISFAVVWHHFWPKTRNGCPTVSYILLEYGQWLCWWGLREGAQLFKSAALLGAFHALFIRAIPSSKYAMGAQSLLFTR